MKHLFFDTETTGFMFGHLPANAADQPWPVQISCLMTDETGKEFGCVELIIRPPCIISEKVAQLHGITEDISSLYGFKPITAVSMFMALALSADVVIAHNLKYDREILESAIARTSAQPSPFGGGKRTICTAELSAPIVNLPPTEKMIAAGRNHAKTPTLIEAYRHFYGKDFEGQHTARADTRACRDVYFACLSHAAAKVSDHLVAAEDGIGASPATERAPE